MDKEATKASELAGQRQGRAVGLHFDGRYARMGGLRGTVSGLVVALGLTVSPVMAVHAEAAHAKAFGEAVKRDTKTVGATFKEGAHRVAAAARAVAHEIATAARRGAAETRAALRGEKTATPAG